MNKILRYFEVHKKLTTFLSIAWTVIIFFGCSMPGRDLPKMGLFDHVDKVIHFSFFLVFFVGWALAFNSSAKSRQLILLVAVLFGFGLEFYQLYFVAGRSFDVWDGVADTAGALCGWLWMRSRNY